jgi:uncharacterized protein (DUF2147 family)
MGLFSSLAHGTKFSRGLFFAAAATIAVFATPGLAQTSGGASVVGFWQATFDDGSPSGWFYFTEKDGIAEGRLVKMYKDPAAAKMVEFCAHCPGAMKGAPMLGLTIVTGMKHHGSKYEDGHILDPRDGSIYNAQLEVSPDGQNLYLRGYIGVPMLGQTKTWTRLPDDVIPVASIPPDPMAPVKKPATPAAAKTPPKAP